MEVQLIQGIILVVVASIFGMTIGALYKIDKLQKAINELKRTAK